MEKAAVVSSCRLSSARKRAWSAVAFTTFDETPPALNGIRSRMPQINHSMQMQNRPAASHLRQAGVSLSWFSISGSASFLSF
jgi:hypothetical protein